MIFLLRDNRSEIINYCIFAIFNIAVFVAKLQIKSQFQIKSTLTMLLSYIFYAKVINMISLLKNNRSAKNL